MEKNQKIQEIIEQYLDVFKRILELSQTIEEGFEHVQEYMKKLEYENALVVLNDINDGFESIESFLEVIIQALPENEIINMKTLLKNNLNNVIYYLKQNESNKARILLDITLLPDIKNWQNELNRILSPYIYS